jgi:hypothetical protein
MNKTEARIVLDKELIHFRAQSHEQLQQLIKSPLVIEREGETGVSYQIEIQAFWDNPRDVGGDIRVIGSIDDGGILSAMSPLSSDFIKDPDGKFIGE